jgi:hypothetical protein
VSHDIHPEIGSRSRKGIVIQHAVRTTLNEVGCVRFCRRLRHVFERRRANRHRSQVVVGTQCLSQLAQSGLRVLPDRSSDDIEQRVGLTIVHAERVVMIGTRGNVTPNESQLAAIDDSRNAAFSSYADALRAGVVIRHSRD